MKKNYYVLCLALFLISAHGLSGMPAPGSHPNTWYKFTKGNTISWILEEFSYNQKISDHCTGEGCIVDIDFGPGSVLEIEFLKDLDGDFKAIFNTDIFSPRASDTYIDLMIDGIHLSHGSTIGYFPFILSTAINAEFEDGIDTGYDIDRAIWLISPYKEVDNETMQYWKYIDYKGNLETGMTLFENETQVGIDYSHNDQATHMRFLQTTGIADTIEVSTEILSYSLKLKSSDVPTYEVDYRNNGETIDLALQVNDWLYLSLVSILIVKIRKIRRSD